MRLICILKPSATLSVEEGCPTVLGVSVCKRHFNADPQGPGTKRFSELLCISLVSDYVICTEFR